MPPAVEAWSLNHWTLGEILLVLLKKIFFLVGWVFVAACKLSLVAAAGGCCGSCGAWTSYCSGFSCCRAWALGAWASEAAAPGPSSCSLQALGLQ